MTHELGEKAGVCLTLCFLFVVSKVCLGHP